MTKKKIGVSKTRPISEARPLGSKKRFDTKRIVPVESEASVNTVLTEASTTTKDTPMSNDNGHSTITVNRNSTERRTTQVVYDVAGHRGSIRVSKSLFPNSEPPATLDVTAVFATPRVPLAKLSAEERKALRAAQPKLTLAEKIAKREKQLAALKAKASAEASAQPSL